MSIDAKSWLQQINALPLREPVKIMNVCGGHERAITQAGLRGALPSQIELIPGPGCPVCVCPEEDVYQAMQLALQESITLVAFGDMLRVPVNVSKGEPRSLDQAHAAGADIRPIASPIEALQIAQASPDREVVFFAAGFETTTAPVAALLVEGIPDNLTILLSGRLTWPAVSMLLSDEKPGFNALVAPGHVATVMGPEEWSFVVQQHHIPAAVAGFTPESLLAATYSVIRQYLDDRIFLDNCYPELVNPGGNPSAKAHLKKAMVVVDANWRGIGIIPNSGFDLNDEYSNWDARKRFPDYDSADRKRSGEMPPGCDCAAVVLGRKYPNQCRLYGKTCTTRTPIGHCMVSDEGACRIWWSGGIRQHRQSQITS
ncbi:MAG: hydrogenase formation protein HypD [Candidatus Thiodiazotropha endolucinida]|nr:hydrogenase formation protein HypD [Candidatus Thiodiazotropha endolucinida]